MKFLTMIGVFATALLVTPGIAPWANQLPSTKPLFAPTYYIAAEVVDCESDPNYVEFRGATNLPPGALMTAVVSDFDSDAWKDFSDPIYVPVTEQGFFAGEIQPLKGVRFHHNLVLQVYFAPFQPKQPDSVLGVIGKKGEKLERVASINLKVSDSLERPAVNPQLMHWSGDIHGLYTIARVPNCGESPN